MRPVRWGLTIGAALLILVVAWVAWQTWQVSQSLTAAADDAAELERAISAGDPEATDRALGQLQEHSSDADSRTSGRTWSTLTHLPVYGDDARGVRLVSSVIADLSGSGLPLIADEAADLDAFVPRNGEVPLDRLVALQQPVARAHAAFASADERLAAEDPSHYSERLKVKYRELASRVASAADSLSTADVALQLMPGMLGQDGPRNYLLVFQNNAEIRATGGLPGAISLLHADAGALTLTKQVAANSFGEAEQPVLPLSEAEKQIYGEQLGTYFLDANFTPDFPRAADLMKARWEQIYKEELDGVFAIDPVALSYFLEAIGPIQAGAVTLTSENAVDDLLHEVYVRYADPKDQDAYFREVARAVFERMVTTGVDDRRGLLRAMGRAADEHRLYLHNFDDSEQRLLAGREIAGELVTDPKAGPQVGVSLNDTTGAKMSYYLRTDVRVQATSCSKEVQTLSGQARIQSIAPLDAAATLPDYVTGGGDFGIPAGDQLVAVRLYAPVDGAVEAIEINSKPVDDVQIVEQSGRPVATVFVLLEPQKVVDLTWRMTTGVGQAGRVTVTVTPGIEAKSSSSVVDGAC